MSQSIAAHSSSTDHDNSADPSEFKFQHADTQILGCYAPYSRLVGRYVAYVQHITSPTEAELRTALQAFEGLTTLEEYWAVIVEPDASFLLNTVPQSLVTLKLFGYRKLKDNSYERLLRSSSYTITQLHDLRKAQEQKLKAELETEFRR